MKKFFLSLAVLVMALCANAQTNQYFWYNGNLMMGNPIAQIDSVTFGEGEPADTLHIMLPRTIIKTVHDTVYITIHDTVCPNAIPEGALAGEFSVSADKKVRFSKGNLQYQASTDTWRFAENQYDIVGNSNANISASYNGWIDLLGWGTGNNPTNSSTSNSNYSTFSDWGHNTISNGGNKANQWRTLTKDEWTYLMHGRNNAEKLIGMGSVNGQNGIIILPDNWAKPNDITFVDFISASIIWNSNRYYNSNNDNYSYNTYTIETWLKIEEAGAIFLPSAGYRHGNSITSVNVDGNYWSASTSQTQSANFVSGTPLYLTPALNGQAYSGHSVRLVQDVE